MFSLQKFCTTALMPTHNIAGLLFLGCYWLVSGKLLKKNEYKINYGLTTLATILLVAMSFSQSQIGGQSFLYLVLCGSLASASMILPGLSGSLVLVLLGNYQVMIEAVSGFHLKTLTPILIGAVLGFIVFVPILKNGLKKYPRSLHSIILGLIIGSSLYLWPWQSGSFKGNDWSVYWPQLNIETFSSLAMIALGLLVFYWPQRKSFLKN